MRTFDKFRLRLRSLFQRRRVDFELETELRFHLDQLIEENIASGMPPEEARMAALRTVGGVTMYQEECRDMRRVNLIEDFWMDLRHAVMVLRRSPGFAATAALTLGLGIGATTAISSVVYGVLLKPLPFHDPDRLVSLLHIMPDGGRNHGPATYFTYRDNQRAFEDIGAWDRDQVTVTGRGDPEQINVLAVSDGTLPLLRVQPLMGRLFTKEDDSPRSPLRVILTYGYWQRRFGGAANIIGQSLVVDGAPAEIIGVLPKSFIFPRSNNAVMLLPMQLDRADATGISFGFQVLARLKPGVTMAQANADLARMIPLLPPTFAILKLQPNAQSQAAYVVGDIGNILWILLGAVGVVLLIACGNVANLFLVRAEGRQQEIAMRAALGASRGRLARALLTESILLALAGGAVGLALAQVTLGLVRRFAPTRLPRIDEIAIDPEVLFFTLIISVLSGVFFGMIAVLKFGNPGAITIKEGGRSASDSRGRHRARNALVVAQVTLTLMLLIVSGLMIRTFVAMRQVPPGFTRPEAVQTFRISIPDTPIPDVQQMARMLERIARRLEQVPGATSVGLASSITMDGENNGNSIEVEEFPVPAGTLSPLFRFKSFAPGYFETMGNRILAGRSITWAEIYAGRPVILISEVLARQYWKEPARALGKRVRTSSSLPWREIVGVVGNERDDGLNRPATPIVYWPLLNDSYQQRTFACAVRSDRVGTSSFQREIEQAVWSVNRDLPLGAVATLDEIQARSMAQTSFTMIMLAIAGSVALFLGIVGIYGVIAYVATQRTREIGIRMALGAQIHEVRWLFVRHGLLLTGGGIVIGILCSLAVTRLMSTLLFGVSPMDPLTYVALSLVLGAGALLAMWLPARRASQIDPMAAIRADR
jgi:predicted permease